MSGVVKKASAGRKRKKQEESETTSTTSQETQESEHESYAFSVSFQDYIGAVQVVSAGRTGLQVGTTITQTKINRSGKNLPLILRILQEGVRVCRKEEQLRAGQ